MRKRCVALVLAGVMMFGQNVYAQEMNESVPQTEETNVQEEVSDADQTEEVEEEIQAEDSTDAAMNSEEYVPIEDDAAIGEYDFSLDDDLNDDTDSINEDIESVKADTLAVPETPIANVQEEIEDYTIDLPEGDGVVIKYEYDTPAEAEAVRKLQNDVQAAAEEAGISSDIVHRLSLDRVFNLTLMSGSDYAGTAKVTFNVPGIEPDSVAYVLHLENGKWTDVTDSKGYDTITGNFSNGFSPVAILVEKAKPYSIYDFVRDGAKPEDIEYLYIGKSFEEIYIEDLSELSKFTHLEHLLLNDVYNSDITVLSNLKNLTSVSLNGCENITDISAIINMPNISHLSLHNMQIPVAQLLQFIKKSMKTSLYKGDTDYIKLDGDYNIDIESDNTKCIEVAGNAHYVAKSPGTAKIKITLDGQSDTYTVSVEGISEKQAVGESADVNIYTDDFSATDTILLNNSELWELYPEPKKISADIKKYVAGWVYVENERMAYTHRLDQNADLWSGSKKIASDVADFSGHYILTKDGVLKDIYNTDSKSLDSVVTWKEIDGAVYVLKSDKTLWKRIEVGKNKKTNEFSKMADGVAYLTDYGYISMKGDYYSFGGKKIANGLCPSEKSISSIKKIEFADYEWDGDVSYIGTKIYIWYEDGALYYYDKNSTILMANKVSWFNVSRASCCYQTSDGKIYTRTNGEVSEVSSDKPAFIGSAGGYVLVLKATKDDGIVQKNDVPILDHVVKIFGTFVYDDEKNSGYMVVYALRTDGTIWSLDGIPKQLDVKAAAYETGFYEIGGQTVYYENGVRSNLSGVVQLWDKNWYNLKNGVLQKGATVANNANGWWYINKDGKADFSYTGMYKSAEKGWIYIRNGKWDTTYTGMAKNSYGWWYMKDGKLDQTYTGMAKNTYGWWYMKKGKLDQTYTGLSSNAYGTWYMKKGKLDTSFSGMYKDASKGWVYLNKGRWDTSYTDVAKNVYGQWYMVNGKLDTSLTGMYKAKSQGWIYVNKGKWDTGYTGMAKNAYGWWYMKNGKLDQTYTGMAKNNYGWWYMKNGKLDTTFTGIAKNAYGSWYMVKGKLANTYSGTVTWNAKKYKVTKGKAVLA